MNKQLLLITLSLFLMSSYGQAQEICNNGIDDDGDGLVDCADCADCVASSHCMDTDNDGISNICDDDDDNDGILDIVENPCRSVSFLNNEQVLQAAYHATLIKTTNDWLIAGQDLNGSGGDQLTFDYISNIYPYPTGATPVKVTIGGASVLVVLFDNGDFYAAGHIGNGAIGTVFPSAVFPNNNWQKISLSLPAGVQPTDIKSMKAAGNMLMILTETGDLYVTGSRVGVELNSGFSALAFTKIPMPAGVTVQYADIAQSSLFIYGSDNNFYRYGQKTYDGDGTSVGAITVQADLMTQPNMSGGFVQMTVGNNGSYLVLDTDGKIYVLGFNIRGQLGVGNTTDVLNWTSIPSVTGAKVIAAINNSGYFSAAGAGYASGFIGADDKAYFFGGNSFSSLTSSAAGTQTTPILAGGANADALYLELGGHITPYISSSFGIYNTGHNAGGAFGDGTTASRGHYSGTSIAGILGAPPEISCTDVDPDMDGITNDLDLDSDGDGCPDVVESGGIDNNNDGVLDGTGFDLDGLVTGGTGGYDGLNNTEYNAHQMTITTPPSDQIGIFGNSTSFSVVASAGIATSYNNGTPIYGTAGNANSGLQYQWYLGNPNAGGTMLSGGGVYSGTATSTLNINNVSTSLAFNEYFVVVTHSHNVCLEEIRSAVLYTTEICNDGLDNDNDGLVDCEDCADCIGASSCADNDNDGVNDVCDLDDDNDGILDVYEMDCSSFTSVGTTTGNPQGISTSGFSGAAFFVGSHLFVTLSNSNYTAVISKTLTGLTAGSNYDITVKGIGSTSGIHPSAIFELKIELGTTVLYDDLLTNFGNTYGNFGDISFSGNALSDDPIFKITLYKPDNLGNIDPRITSFEYTFCNPSDIDNDNIFNDLDLDSDGDGCFDVVESGGTDANNDGILNGTGFDSDGKVTGGLGGYNGINSNEYKALRIITIPMNNQNITSGNSASFSVSATGSEATSFNAGTPIYGTNGNSNAGLNYQWYIGHPNSGGTPINNGSVYSGATTSTLNISDITGLNGTEYYVRVTHDDNVCLEALESATLTFDPCDASVSGEPDNDNDGIADNCDDDDDNDGILDIVECSTRLNETAFSIANGDSANFSLAAFGDGFVLDVTNLDNNFQLKINGVNLFTQELEFQHNSVTNNIRFQDGSLFGTGGPLHVYQYVNVNPETPILRFIIDENLNVSMFGSKAINGSLYPLELFNGAALNTFTWNTSGVNEFVVTQHVSGPTSMIGRVYDSIDLCDIDGDGVDNNFDLDSDGDGCFDVVESGGLDLNNDGVLDGTSIDISGLVVGGLGGYNGTNGTEILGTQVSVITPPSDQLKNTGEATTISIIAQADAATAYSSGTPLYGTSGNDNANLIYEWYLGNPNTTGTLIFDGGIYSGATTNTLNISSVTGLNGTQYCVVVSHANNPCIEEIRCMILSVNTTEICDDGQDNDGDGLIDCADPDCSPIIADVVPTPLSCPVGTIDGQIIITAIGPGTLTYSITNEPNYQVSNTFSNLGQGLYTIRVQSSTGCTDTYDAAIIQFDTPNCLEICDDGIDNDGDGLVDCDDTDCSVLPTSNIVAEDN